LNEQRKFNVSDGIAVGAMSLLGYACAYFFEKGYLGYYYLPDTLIEISIPTVIKSIAYVLVAVLILIIVLNGLLSGIPVFKNEFINLAVSRFLWILILLFLPTLFSGLTTLSLLTFLGAAILFGFFIFGMPIIKYRKIKDYKNKIKQAEFDEKSEHYEYSLVTLLRKKFGRKGIISAIVFLYIIASFSYVQRLGGYWASQQESYFLITDPKPMIVVGTYKNNFITAEVNLSNREIYPSYKIMKAKNLEAEMIQVKGLKVRPPLNK